MRQSEVASRSSAHLAALSALRDAGVSCTDQDAPATILTALQEHVISVATSDQAVFDRGHFDRLMALWEDLAAEDNVQGRS